MSDSCKKQVRKLHGWEVDEFSQVFGDSLDYDRVRIHECATWTDFIDTVGRKIKKQAPLQEGEHNAITLGNHCFFPVELPSELVPVGHSQSYKLDWLVHELTHAWQYQKMGWIYLFKAVYAQIKAKAEAYNFGGEEGLLKSRQKNKPFKDFNPEQQGNITQAYYVRKRAGKNVDAWDPYIQELKSMLKGDIDKG